MVGMMVVGVGLASCHSPFAPDLVCTAEINSTIAVRVLDAAGTTRIAGVTLVLRRGSFVDSVTTTSAVQFADADYRWWEDRVGGGTYTLAVKKSGYAEQHLTVVVERDACHSGPGPLVEVRLQPAGAI